MTFFLFIFLSFFFFYYQKHTSRLEKIYIHGIEQPYVFGTTSRSMVKLINHEMMRKISGKTTVVGPINQEKRM